MTTNPQDLTDAELKQSQWVELREIAQLTQTTLEVSYADALRALRLRDLAAVRPAILFINTCRRQLTNLNDVYAHSCIEKALTPHGDWEPFDPDDPSAATVEFSILAFLDWHSGTNLRLPIDEFKAWKRDTHHELKRRRLLVEDTSKQTVMRDIGKVQARMTARFIRLRDAPDYLGMNKNRFNQEVRPEVTKINLGARGIAFDKRELDEWAERYKQKNGRPGEQETVRQWRDGKKASTKGAMSGTSTKSSADGEFTKAQERLRKRKPSGS